MTRSISLPLLLVALIVAGCSPTASTAARSPGAAASAPSRSPGPTPTPALTGLAPGINVEPAMRPWRFVGPNPDGWWCGAGACNGVADGTVFVDREMPLVQGLGVKVLRIEFPWFLVEPGRDQYVWTRADYIVRSASTHHVELQPVIVYSPPWAAPQPSNPPDAAAFGAFAAAAARRYAGTIRYWEIWNEPNLGKYWTGGAQSYVSKLLAPAYQAIHGASADAEVMLGGPAGADMNWLNAVHAAGGAFDILAFHDYGSAASIKNNAVSLHTWLEGIGQAGTPIWLGEFGVQQSEVHDTSQQGLITAVLKGNAPLAVAEWYNLRDDFSMTCCPPQVAVTGYWGLVKHDGQTLKDGYQTMQRLAPPG